MTIADEKLLILCKNDCLGCIKLRAFTKSTSYQKAIDKFGLKGKNSLVTIDVGDIGSVFEWPAQVPAFYGIRKKANGDLAVKPIEDSDGNLFIEFLLKFVVGH
jgi:hypothetical protein